MLILSAQCFHDQRYAYSSSLVYYVILWYSEWCHNTIWSINYFVWLVVSSENTNVPKTGMQIDIIALWRYTGWDKEDMAGILQAELCEDACG